MHLESANKTSGNCPLYLNRKLPCFSKDFTKDINYRKTACQIKNQIHAHSFIHYQLPKFNNHKIIRAEIINSKSTGKVCEIVEENNKYIIINSIDYDIKLYKHS